MLQSIRRDRIYYRSYRSRVERHHEIERLTSADRQIWSRSGILPGKLRLAIVLIINVFFVEQSFKRREVKGKMWKFQFANTHSISRNWYFRVHRDTRMHRMDIKLCFSYTEVAHRLHRARHYEIDNTHPEKGKKHQRLFILRNVYAINDVTRPEHTTHRILAARRKLSDSLDSARNSIPIDHLACADLHPYLFLARVLKKLSRRGDSISH